jgi:hypothetical protein
MSTLALFAPEVVGNVDSTDAQCTPRDLALDLGWFDLDVASNPRSHIKTAFSYMLERGEDGLSMPWFGKVFCNGPYSNPLPWCQRLRQYDGIWVALWKADFTTEWFRQLMSPGPSGQVAQWAVFRDRLTFERPGNVGSANFCSVLVWRDWTPPAAVAARLWMPMRGGS